MALVCSVGVLVMYLLLMRIDPHYGFFGPRGGMFTLGLSLCLANGGIWLAAQQDRPLHERFQYAVVGWIWLLVQLGAIVYVYMKARGS